MPDGFISNGWEYRRQGDEYVPVRPVASQSLGITKPADPNAAVDRALKAAELNAKVANAATAPFDARKAAADATAAEIGVKLKERELAAGPSLSEGQAKAQENAKAKLLAATEIQRQLQRAKSIYDTDFAGQGLGSVIEYLPTDANRRFDAVADAMSVSLKPLIRGPGEGTWTDADQALLERLTPRPNKFDPANEEIFNELSNRIQATQKQYGGAPAASTAAPPPATPPATPPDFSGVGPNGPQIGLAGGEIRQEYDPQVSAQLNRAIRAGLPYEQAMKLVPPGTPLADRKDYAAAVRYAREHPEYKKSLAEFTRAVRNNAWQRFASSPLAAGISGAANAATAGYSDELAGGISAALGGDYEQTRDQFDVGKKLLAAENPVADLTGNVAGGVTGMLGVARLPGVMAAMRAAPRAAPIATDVAYGAAYGSGENNENRLLGAGVGGATALGAGALGRGVVRKLGNAIGGPELQPAVQRLVDRGFILSPAQRAAGGVLGMTRKRVDDALRSSPLVGDAITAQGARQYSQLGRATVDEALGPIGIRAPEELEGNKLIEFANQKASDAFDAPLAGIQAPLDEPFIAGNNAVRSSVATLPEPQQQMFNTIYNRAVKPFIPDDGVLTGKALQDIKRGLDKQIVRLAKTDNPADEYLADELSNLRTVFFDWAGRAAPDKVADFRAANAAWANMIRVNRAAAAAKKDGVFSPDQLLGAIKANSSDAQFASGGLPMQQLAQDAQGLLPSTLPESGTVPRAMVNMGGLGASGIGAAAVPSLSPLLALPVAKAAVHAPGVDKILQAIALRRAAALARTGKAIRKRQRLGGAVAVPLAVENATVNR